MNKIVMNNSKKNTIAIVAFVLVVAVLAGLFYRTQKIKNILAEVETDIRNDWGALAADRIEHYRYQVIGYEKGCSLMMGAYFKAQKFDRLEWAAEACLEAGVVLPDTFLSLATIKEVQGHDDEALERLAVGLQKFPGVADLHMKVAQLLAKNNSIDQAVQAYIKASDEAVTNIQMTYDIVIALSKLNRWKEARVVADRMKSIKTESPEVKLVLARVYKKNGDQKTTQSLLEEAKAQLKENPALSAQLIQNYKDLF